ncbi:hypothetical protein GA0116948_10690 [Chitinophaga costaii]|uniref:Uncharacterized protein n=1 Tax=Chitinophaga costaii TaxID=1335309 RepID=A0A1C4DSS2_9BACT|nr:hypothetical protein GA0116948_10690 [Chitinophaga costaii]
MVEMRYKTPKALCHGALAAGLGIDGYQQWHYLGCYGNPDSELELWSGFLVVMLKNVYAPHGLVRVPAFACVRVLHKGA